MAADQKDPRRMKRLLNTMQSGISSVQSSIQSSMSRQGNSTFYTASIQQQKSLKCGWLKKQGGVVKSWHRRWFTIKGDHMYYFSSEDESKPPLGFIFLPGNKVIEYTFNPAEPDKFLFEIQPGGDRNRMTTTHETYPLDAITDDERKDWVRVIRRVMYADIGGAIFGQSLEDTMRYELRFNRKIPQIVQNCVEYLTNQGLETEGIFRLPGRSSVIRQLRETFDCGERPDLLDPATEADFNTVASLLKQYLRELPEPIIPPYFYEPVMKAVIRDMPTNRELGMQTFSEILQEMAPTNYNLLQYVCRFLQSVSQKSDVNKMTDTNLATVFAQCIIRPEDEDPALLMGTAGNRTQVVLVLIRDHNEIFKLEYTAAGNSVKIDDLLDIGDSLSNNSFDVEAMSYYSVPKSNSNESDLLGLDMDSFSCSDRVLPQPIFPASSAENIEQDQQNGAIETEDKTSEYEKELYYSVSSQPPEPECIQNVACVEEEEEDDEIDSPPVFGSSRASMLQGDVKIELTYKRSNCSKMSPVPPPRPSKRQPAGSNTSADSNITNDSLSAEDEEDETRIKTMLSTDLYNFSDDELRSFVETLFVELRSQRSKVKQLRCTLRHTNQQHKQQLNKMAEKVNLEREATTGAVEKVMKVQAELEEYQLRYSGITD